jgi:hypothetical protein
MTNADKPAYPDPMRGALQSVINQTPHELQSGLTKRELIAAMCLQGFIASPGSFSMGDGKKEWTARSPEDFAILARDYADALLEELDKPKT